MFKVIILQVVQKIINNTKGFITRWVVRDKITNKELPFYKWFNPSFLLEHGVGNAFWFLFIASFTALTFPIGLQISSYNLSKSFPSLRIINGLISLVVMPYGFYVASKVLNELPINKYTVGGLILCEISYMLIMIGGYLMTMGVN